METIHLKPIAFVKSHFSSNTPAEEMRSAPSQLIFEPEYEPGLLGLEPGMDILVLFYIHQTEPAAVKLQLHPRHNPDNPIRGVFATRSQFRPNSIGATVARIEAIEANILTVSQLDALDGSPVLDVKPHVPFFDTATDRQQLEVHEVASLDEARQVIDRIDAEVIRLLGNRADFVRQVTRFKKDVSEVPAPTRYAEVMRRRRDLAEAAGLNPDVIEGMYKLLVDYFIREETEIIQRREPDCG